MGSLVIAEGLSPTLYTGHTRSAERLHCSKFRLQHNPSKMDELWGKSGDFGKEINSPPPSNHVWCDSKFRVRHEAISLKRHTFLALPRRPKVSGQTSAVARYGCERRCCETLAVVIGPSS